MSQCECHCPKVCIRSSAFLHTGEYPRFPDMNVNPKSYTIYLPRELMHSFIDTAREAEEENARIREGAAALSPIADIGRSDIAQVTI